MLTLLALLASRRHYLFDKCLLLYVQSWTPDDGQKDCPKHVGCHSKIKQIWYTGASGWFYYRNNITMHGPVNVKCATYIFLLYMYLVLKECWEAPTVVCNTEVLRFWSYLFHNVIIELWHPLQEAAQLHVVEYLFFILCH